MDSGTRFHDDEIRRILARAAERQEQAERALPAASAGSAAGPEPGLTLAELQEVAQEVGIAPAHVRAAAREVASGTDGPAPRYRLLGIPKDTADHRVVPGRPTDREWERIVQELREEFRVPGVTNSFGDVLEWWSSGVSSVGAVRLRLEPGEQGAHVTLRRSNAQMANLTHALGWTFAGMAGLFGGALALGGLGPKAIVAPLFFGGLSAATVLGGRFLSRWSARRERARFARILDRIDLIVRGGGSP